jgi:hypothetical protein
MKSLGRFASVYLIAAALVSGCDFGKDSQQQDLYDAQQKQIDALSERVSGLSEQFSEFKRFSVYGEDYSDLGEDIWAARHDTHHNLIKLLTFYDDKIIAHALDEDSGIEKRETFLIEFPVTSFKGYRAFNVSEEDGENPGQIFVKSSSNSIDTVACFGGREFESGVERNYKKNPSFIR